ncbi:MAG: alpha/beta hydrolase [Oscillospiraceae bacterium]|nr:alpha/beta hydrolase [Oscillospiraceae bacterium]
MENLWGDQIPYWDDTFIEQEETEPRKPTITAYPAHSKGAVIVFAGGAYLMRAEHEGKGYAEFLNSIGMTAFVVDYRVAPYKHPAQISDAIRAVRYVRYHADKYGIDKDKIAVMGSSAGGHLAGSVSVHYDKKMYEETDEIDKTDCKPNATVLCYPVIDMFEYRHDGSRQNLIGERALHADKEFMSLYKHITKDTPQAFIWHTSSDQAVPVENSLMYADALSKVQVPFEMHIYPLGPHGLGIASEVPHVAQWLNSLDNWLKLISFK